VLLFGRAQVDLLIAEQQGDSFLLSMSRIEVFPFHAQDALIPLCGDLHVSNVCYEIIKGTDFDGHNAPSEEQS